MLHCMPRGLLPVERYALDTVTTRRGLASLLGALAPRALSIGAMVAAVSAALLAPVGGSALGVGIGLSVAFGLLAHEAGHAAFMGGRCVALTLNGPRASLLHRRLTGARRRVVAAGGPIVPAALGWAALVTASVLHALVLAEIALPLISHAIALTIISPDGRKTCGIT